MKTFAVYAPTLPAGSRSMFEALGGALGVSFVEREFPDERNIDAWILLDANRKTIADVDRATRPCYVVPGDSELVANGSASTIACADRPDVPAVLRGRDFTADDAADVKTLPGWISDIVALAFKSAAPVWAVKSRGTLRHHFVSMPPPQLEATEPLFSQFSGQRIARLLPLVSFVRALTDEPCWQPPPLQASLMFDDPNLHWTSYGFIDYAELIEHATARNYHVAFATIPLDAWFVHGPTSAIFKSHADRVSLLFHGNDHVANELGAAPSAEQMREILAQAIDRIARMEARTGLDVARVMAPPHGACAERAIASMASLAFDAVCVSRGSLRFHNPGAEWTRTIGMTPCDHVAGLSVIPRFGLTATCQNDILIAALLHQPIVPMTHHQGVADGYRLLDDTAAFVNSLGPVAWRDMKTISRSLYSWRQDEGTLRLKMWSHRVDIDVPVGTRTIHVDHVPGHSPTRSLHWRSPHSQHWETSPDRTIAVSGQRKIEIGVNRATVGGGTRTGLPRLAPVARRIATEGRDRVLPAFRRLMGGRTGRIV